MSDAAHIVIGFSAKGMDASLDGSLLAGPEGQHNEKYARAVNLRLHEQLPRTRLGIRQIPILTEDDDDIDLLAAWEEANTQGAIFYNPSRGQGALHFGIDQSSILESAGGKRYRVRPIGRKARTIASIEEITNGFNGDPHLHLAWWTQAEKYAICSDGVGSTWIYDGSNPARWSVGYEAADRDDREVPNAATSLVYAHGRVHAVVNAREIHAGDQLHLINQGSPVDVLKFTQIQYLNTGQKFAPPSSMGNILAMSVMALKNTQHGHEGVFAHCEDGLFSVNTNVAPREDWDKLALTRHALLKTAAAGPYAVDIWDGDLVFRSRYGIQTFRSAAAESGFVGNPYSPISEEVHTFMEGDREGDLRFASLSTWYPQRRLFATVYPLMRLRHRYHRGFIVANFNPRGTTVTGERAWEGLWTLPNRLGGIIQFIDGIFVGDERLFFLSWNQETQTKSLCEVVEWSEVDLFADNTSQPIHWQLWTRNTHIGRLYESKKFSTGRLYLKDVRGTLKWRVAWRGNGEGEWKHWRQGSVTVDVLNEDGLTTPGGRDLVLELGEFPLKARDYRWVQFMIQGEGVASIEALKIRHGKIETEDDLSPTCADAGFTGRLQTRNYDDYAYTDMTEEERWTPLPKNECN